jgi:hypothetical protein
VQALFREFSGQTRWHRGCNQAGPALVAPALAMYRTKRRQSWIGKRLRCLGVTLLALEMAYLIFGNLFLHFGLRRLVNTDPETVLMEYGSAYSLWPGTASVRRFSLRSQDRSIQWHLEVEQADVTVELGALFGKTFHASRVRAEGVSFRLRRKLSDAADPRAAFLPPIAGFADPPLQAIGPETPPLTDAEYDLFTANLEDTDAAVHEIWVDEFRLSGPAHVNARWFFKPLRTMQLGPLTLDTRSASLEVAGKKALTSLDVHLTATVGAVELLGPLTPNVRQISGRGGIDARVTNLEFLRFYLGDASTFHVDDGSGVLHVVAEVEQGRAMPGTVLQLRSDHLVFGTADAEATVAFSCEARVEASNTGPIASGDLHVREATVVLASRDGAPPRIEDAHAHFHGLPRDPVGTLEIERTELDVPVRIPDLGWLLPRPKKGEARDVHLAGEATLRARTTLDRRFRAAGSVEAHAVQATVTATKLAVSARYAANLGFDDLDFGARSLLFRPSLVTAEQVAITRHGRTHRGGAARVDLTAGRVDDGHVRDLALTIGVKHPDLSWLALRAVDRGSLGAAFRSGELTAKVLIRRPDALFDGSAADAAVTGTFAVSGAGDARLQGVVLRGRVAATGLIDALHLGRRTLRLRELHLTARDVSVERGSDRTFGWWGDFHLPKLDGSLAPTLGLDAHLDARCRDGGPFLAVLVGADAIPGWIPSLFPMKQLTASMDIRRARRVTDIDLLVRSTSANVEARLRDLGDTMKGGIHVDTDLVSIGVSYKDGESDMEVFAGEDWLKEHLDTAARGDARP